MKASVKRSSLEFMECWVGDEAILMDYSKVSRRWTGSCGSGPRHAAREARQRRFKLLGKRTGHDACKYVARSEEESRAIASPAELALKIPRQFSTSEFYFPFTASLHKCLTPR